LIAHAERGLRGHPHGSSRYRRANVRAFFFGGGIDVPLRERISVFGDVRLMVGAEAGELLAVLPVSVGIACRF